MNIVNLDSNQDLTKGFTCSILTMIEIHQDLTALNLHRDLTMLNPVFVLYGIPSLLYKPAVLYRNALSFDRLSRGRSGKCMI